MKVRLEWVKIFNAGYSLNNFETQNETIKFYSKISWSKTKDGAYIINLHKYE